MKNISKIFVFMACVNSSLAFASSSSGTVIPPATLIVDSSNSTWTLSGGTCYRNGVQAAGTVPGFDCAGISTVLWYQNRTYVNGSDGSWWKFVANGPWWTQVAGDPRGSELGLVLNAPWVLTVNQDFTKGPNPSLYTTFCGSEGSGNAANNFAANNVYWENGALVLRLQNLTNTSCTGVTRPYAGAGFALNIKAASSIATEFEIMGTDTYGVAPYALLALAAGVAPACGWGLEDDFFEQNSTLPVQNVQSYHFWVGSASRPCVHQFMQLFADPPNIGTSWHRYAVVRDGGVSFFIDGAPQEFGNGTYVATAGFQNYPVSIQMGLGAYTANLPNPAQLPAYVKIRNIKVWYKQ